MDRSFGTTPSGRSLSGTPGSSRAASISKRLSSILTPKVAEAAEAQESSSKENDMNGATPSAPPSASSTPSSTVSNARRLSNILRKVTTPGKETPAAASVSQPKSSKSVKSSRKSFSIPTLAAGMDENVKMSEPKSANQTPVFDSRLPTTPKTGGSTTSFDAMASLRDVAAKSPGRRRTPSKTPTKSPARASASSTTKLLLSASKRTPTNMSLTGRVDSSKKSDTSRRQEEEEEEEVVEEEEEVVEEAEIVEEEQVVRSAATPSSDLASLLAPTPPQPKPFLFDTATNYNPRRATLGAPVTVAAAATQPPAADINAATTTPVNAAAALAKANARRHTLSTRKIEEQKKLLQEKTALAAATAAATATTSPSSSLTKVPASAPLASSPPVDTNFEEASEIEEELPTLGGEDISVIEMKPSTHKKKRKATRENDKRKSTSRRSSVGRKSSMAPRRSSSAAVKKSRMSIGAMIRADRGGDHYLHEALLAECRRVEADADLIEFMEENRQLRMKMINDEVAALNIKNELQAAVKDGMEHIAMRAVEHTVAIEEMGEKFKGEMSVVKEALDSERSARQSCMKQLENLKKKFGVVDDPVEDEEDTESEEEGEDTESDGDDVVEEAVKKVVAVKKAQQKKQLQQQKKKQPNASAKKGTRGRKAYKYDEWDESSSEEDSEEDSDEESEEEADEEVNTSTDSNRGRKRKGNATQESVKNMKPKLSGKATKASGNKRQKK